MFIQNGRRLKNPLASDSDLSLTELWHNYSAMRLHKDYVLYFTNDAKSGMAACTCNSSSQKCLDCSIISWKLAWAKQHGFFFLKVYLVMEKLLFLFCKIINQKMLSNWLKADE